MNEYNYKSNCRTVVVVSLFIYQKYFKILLYISFPIMFSNSENINSLFYFIHKV